MFSGYKTVIFNIVMVVIMVAHVSNPTAQLPDAHEVQGQVDTFLEVLGTVWTLGNIILRALTTSPIFNGKLHDLLGVNKEQK